MDRQEISNILRCERFEKVYEKIESQINENNYKGAYHTTTGMLELINAIILLKKFKVNIQNTNIITYIEYYSTLDNELYNQMKSVNTEYNSIDEDNITIEDIQYLLLKIDYIVAYINDTYGEIFV